MYRSITLGSFSREVYVGHGQTGYFVRNKNGCSSRQQGIILGLWRGQFSVPRQGGHHFTRDAYKGKQARQINQAV
jgi:hypothetical protein